MSDLPAAGDEEDQLDLQRTRGLQDTTTEEEDLF